MSKLHDKASKVKAAFLNHFRGHDASLSASAKPLNAVGYNPLFNAKEEPKWRVNPLADDAPRLEAQKAAPQAVAKRAHAVGYNPLFNDKDEPKWHVNPLANDAPRSSLRRA